ncbi:hypothetical protein Tco_0970007 [Tanacetum coccineum]
MNDRVPSTYKSNHIKNKEVEVEEHSRNLLISKNKKHMSSECNNIKLAIQNDKSEIVCPMCKQCLITANHDVCVLNYVNVMNSRSQKQMANVSNTANQTKHMAQVIQICLWYVDLGCSKHMTENLKLLINFVWKFLGTVRFGNDHVAAILGFDPRLSQVVLGTPFVKVSNMTHDPPEGVVRFTNGTDKIAYKMPHKIEQYNSLSDLEREHTKSVYLRNEEGKRKGVEYVMSKILGFYKECLELGPKYLTRIANEGEVT